MEDSSYFKNSLNNNKKIIYFFNNNALTLSYEMRLFIAVGEKRFSQYLASFRESQRDDSKDDNNSSLFFN